MTGLELALLRGALTSPFKRPGRGGATLPATRVSRDPVVAPAELLARYRQICRFPAEGPFPLTYPHVLAFPLAMRLMTARSFPLPVLGLVHTWIEITSHRPVRPTEPLRLSVYAQELRPHRRGTEVTVSTEARVADELVWESRSGYLARHAVREAPAAPAPAPLPDLPSVAEWRLTGDLGRRYGAASGDRNPIHLHPLTARLFGFPRAIAHGMWTVARCLAEAEGAEHIRAVRAEFRAPVLLPGTVTYAADGSGTTFQLRSGPDGERLHLTGSVIRDL
ncbi:MaoC/PaaZ C-terminal domain-containing protein [Streptomyces sp. NBC_00102]|uniref:MaoC family dehydratase n=1 Tax=Streptomyces sp. NBC_00102 TaxID=2975652 RepID=UPI00225AD19E|nr:MaoC/PaaZ C-terminal domain-containing protein [Streptomyces sp. NBC_00102]MCX5398892.1 MaoC/PaaZ C-terminal domain-containing protein [Streptomyces sp. NBC_00102]